MKTKFFKLLLSVIVLTFLTVVASEHPSIVHADMSHCGILSGNETWSASDNVHIVTCDVTIPSGVTLTIEAGAIIKFQQGVQINVNGKLIAQGTSNNPIYFTSYYDDSIGDDTDGSPTAGAVGDWGNIQFNSSSDDTSTITHAVIRYSGQDYCCINNDGAIRLDNASPILSYITFTDNYINGVQIQGNRDWQTDTWDNTTIIYVIEGGDITIPAANTLTINPGMKVKLTNATSINVDGKLSVPGTSDNPVYFSSYLDDVLCGVGAFDEGICDSHNDGSSAGAVGDWGNIQFNSGSDDTSTITRAVIRYSGQDYCCINNDGAIRLDNASPILSYITFTDNYINGVQIQGNRDWQTDTWDNTTVVYLIEEGDVTIPAANTLTIMPGMKIKMGTYNSINVDGKLTVSSASANPVYFSSYQDDTLCGIGAFDELICDSHNDGSSRGAVGDWGNIQFNSGSDDTSTITRAVIRYSGKDGCCINDDGAIRLINASPTISYTRLVTNYQGIEALDSSRPTLVCNDIYDNTDCGLLNRTPATMINAESHWWGDASGPYHPTLNPSGTGDRVSDGVDFHPWRTTSCISSRLEASKVADKTLAKPSDVLTYTVVAKETSGNPAPDASISDPIPANTTYVNGSAQIEPSGTGVLTPTASTIQWSGPVAASSSVTLTFRVNVTTSLSSDTTVVNTATIGDGQGGSFTRAATTTIDALPPTSTITAPAAGQILSGTTYLVHGTAFDATSGVAQVEVSSDGGASWQAATGTTDWIYTWTLPADGVYTLTSRATDHVGHVQTPDPGFAVTVDNTPPTSTIASPTNGQVITATVYTISGSAADNLSGVDKVEVSTNGGSTWSQASGTTAWSYLWSMPGEDNVTHVLKSHARDQAGNLESTGVVTVTVDNIRPMSVIIDPVEGQILTSTTYLVVGTASDGSGIAKVEVSTDSGASWQAAVGTTNWVYTWTLPVTGTYTVRTRATDGAQNVEEPGPGVTVGVGQSPEADFLIYLPIILKNR
jgi:uncharacterized repeat protein (TIGR01451 family)